MTEKDILNYFKDDLYWSGGESYLPRNQCLSFVKKCRDECILILGIESYLIDGNSIFPQIEHIADFSELKESSFTKRVDKLYVSSLAFMESVPVCDNQYFNFVLDRED